MGPLPFENCSEAAARQGQADLVPGDEAGKSLAHMDIVGEKNAAGVHPLPGGLKLESHISGGVQAVMQEDVRRRHLLEEARQHIAGV
jgi:hypothetical protein